MTEAENILTQIGEFVYTEIDQVDQIEYAEENGILIAFDIIMENDKQYSIEIKEKV